MARQPTQRELRRLVSLCNDEPDLSVSEAARIVLDMNDVELGNYLEETHSLLIASLPQRQLETFNRVCVLADCENLALVAVSPATRTARTSGE